MPVGRRCCLAQRGAPRIAAVDIMAMELLGRAGLSRGVWEGCGRGVRRACTRWTSKFTRRLLGSRGARDGPLQAGFAGLIW